MKTIFQCFVLTLSISFLSSNAQVKTDKGPVITLKPGSPTELMPDSINVDFYLEVVRGIYGRKRLFIKPTNGTFVINLPRINHLSRLKFYFKYGRSSLTSNFYFIEPTDNVEILFTRSDNRVDDNDRKISLRFSGKGAKKFAIVDTMRLAFNSLNREVTSLVNKLKNSKVTDYQSSSFMQFCDELYAVINLHQKKNREILQNSRKNIGDDLTEFYYYELDGGYEFFQRVLHGYYTSAKSEKDKQVISDVHFRRKPSLDYNNEHPWIKYSAHYITNESYCKMLDTYYQHDGKKYLFKDQYNNLKKVKSLDLRERLITELFMLPLLHLYIGNFESRDSCMKDALSVVKSPILKTALNEQFIFSKGSKVYPFSFPDTAGNIVSLQSMRGKVFILEFYGEGCGGCAGFAKLLKSEIYPEFADNPNFKVISVSVDRTKERWFKALNSGLYTQKDVYINLNVGKAGMDHPMLLKYYKVNAIPLVLLIDKNGNLIAKVNGMGANEISAKIRASLNEASLDM